MNSTVAVLDANVLYPATLRDTLLTAAYLGLFRPHWSEEILEEATRNLTADERMGPAQRDHLLRQLKNSFPGALQDDYQHLVAAMPNHPKDRHVAAVAVAADADIIVTCNLKVLSGSPPAD